VDRRLKDLEFAASLRVLIRDRRWIEQEVNYEKMVIPKLDERDKIRGRLNDVR